MSGLSSVINAKFDPLAQIVRDPGAVLIHDDIYAQFLETIRADIRAFIPDLSTAMNRKEIASKAYQITRFKTAIDDAGKKLTEEAREHINKINAKRRIVKDDLESLAAEARRPLTQWEEQEEARAIYCKVFLQSIEDCGNGLIGGSRHPFDECLQYLAERLAVTSELGEFEDQARVAHRIATDKLEAAHEAFQREERDRKELEELRAWKEAKAKEESERLAKEQFLVEEAERERLRQEAAKQQAEAARIREEQIAKDAREKAEREAQAAIEEARRHAEAKIAEAEQRALREAQMREETIRRESAEQLARELNQRHRLKIIRLATAGFTNRGFDKSTAEAVMSAIVGGYIPHVKIEF